MNQNKTKLEIINDADSLSALNRHQWARLLGNLEPCSYEEGEVIQQAGESITAFHQFIKGSSPLRFDPPSNASNVNHECGEECLAGFDQYLFTVVATGETQGWKLSAQAAKDISKEVVEVKNKALKTLTTRLRETTGPMVDKQPTLTELPRLPLFQRIGWLASIVAPFLLYISLYSSGVSSTIAIFLAIMLVVILLWFFSLVEQFIPPIIGISAVIFTGLTPADTALSGFASSSFLELLCVLVVSSVLMSSGLSFRLLLGFLRLFPKRESWQSQIPLFLGFIVSPVIPSNNSRMALLLPIVQEIVSLTRIQKNSLAISSILACCYSASVIFSNMLPTSKATTIALIGVLPVATQAEFNGLFWFKAAFLVTLGMFLSHLALTKILFKSEDVRPISAELIKEGLSVLGPMNYAEYAAGISVLVLIIGTMSYDYHHIPMSSISGLTLFSLLSLGLISKTGFRKDIDWALIFFLMGSQCLIKIADSLGIDHLILSSLSGISDWIQKSPWRFTTTVIAIMIPLRFMLPGPPSALLATTLFTPIALQNQISPWIALFICGFLSDIWFLPYQSGSWSQSQSLPISKYMSAFKFNLYNQSMNLVRIMIVYLCIPYWQWLRIL